eukprot:9366258-Ditylum_brightwellii.AAC.1
MEEISFVESSSESFASDVLSLLLSEDDDTLSSNMEAMPRDISRSWMSCAVLDVVGSGCSSFLMFWERRPVSAFSWLSLVWVPVGLCGGQP